VRKRLCASGREDVAAGADGTGLCMNDLGMSQRQERSDRGSCVQEACKPLIAGLDGSGDPAPPAT